MNAPLPLLDPPPEDIERARALTALRLLAANPALSQRELARALGVSLGKTHYVLHALLDKGLVKASNFRRSNNKMAYAYVLTPRGLREKVRMTRSFLSSKEAEFEQLRQTISALRRELAGQDEGVRAVGGQASTNVAG